MPNPIPDLNTVTNSVGQLAETFSTTQVWGLVAAITVMWVLQFGTIVWILLAKFKQAEKDRSEEIEERRRMWANYTVELGTLRKERDNNRTTFSEELSVERAMSAKREQELGNLLEQRHQQHMQLMEKMTNSMTNATLSTERLWSQLAEHSRIIDKFSDTLDAEPNLACKHCPNLVDLKKRHGEPPISSDRSA
jgi:hypothetical protein